MKQLVIERPLEAGEKMETTRPLEDAGLIILDHPQITLTLPLIQHCILFNLPIVVCDEKHLPAGIMLSLAGHSLSGMRMRSQVESGKALKKRLWQKTISAKIKNQAKVLKTFKLPYQYLLTAATKVRSGDSANTEAMAASYYWSKLFASFGDFRRDRFGDSPNQVLNYAYAILRASVARALIGSGLFPFLGIHHKNTYNSLCLADDIMEPFRPYADALVKMMILNGDIQPEDMTLTRSQRKACLELLNGDVKMEGMIHPMQIAIKLVCSRLAKCFEEDNALHLSYPEYE